MMAEPPIQRIVLTGFMGSGKTTVGRVLAEQLSWEFRDLDREVEVHSGLSVPAIFADHGEAHFRELEATVLSALLPRPRLILALGGGAPEFPATADLLQAAPSTLIAFLAAPFGTLADRCRAESKQPGAIHRPLFADERAAHHRFFRREPLYLKLAHLTVSTADIAPADVAAVILAAAHARDSAQG